MNHSASTTGRVSRACIPVGLVGMAQNGGRMVEFSKVGSSGGSLTWAARGVFERRAI